MRQSHTSYVLPVSSCVRLAHLPRRVPEVRDLHAVQPHGRRADVVREVDDELQQQPREARRLRETNQPTKRSFNDSTIQRLDD